MRKYYKKDYSFRDSDFVNNYIGYWTDNGKQFEWKLESEKSCQWLRYILRYKFFIFNLIPYYYCIPG